MAVKPGRRGGSSKNPPLFSHEFVIANHADIVACVAMVFVGGLMFQVSSPAASLFIALHHNVTIPVEAGPNGMTVEKVFYTQGPKDIPAIFFYLLIAIVMHQIIQEYLLDKVNRKLHLSKVKHAKFNESGQLLAFYLVSVFWGVDIMVRENLFAFYQMWEGYPHVLMTFMFKFFYIVQFAYWLHVFPELYFQKVKREDMASRMQYAVLYLFFIGVAYALNFTRIGLLFLLIHYVTEAISHAARLLHYADKVDISIPLFKLRDLVFYSARFVTMLIAILVFYIRFPQLKSQADDPNNYNTPFIRAFCLSGILILQLYTVLSYWSTNIRRRRENATSSSSSNSGFQTRNKKTQQEKAKARKENKPSKKDDVDDLPEVDQNTNKSMLRQRK